MSANRETVTRMAYGYELMHTAICHMAGTSGADARWYKQKADEVFARVSPVFAIKADSNAHKPGDCLSSYRSAVPLKGQTIEEALPNIVAEHDLVRLDIGFASYDHGARYGATAWWNGGHSCEFGHGDTVDAAVNDALDKASTRRAVVQAEAA